MLTMWNDLWKNGAVVSLSWGGKRSQSKLLRCLIAIVIGILSLSVSAGLPANATAPTAWSVYMSPNATLTTVQITTSFTGLAGSSAIQLRILPVNIAVADGFAGADGSVEFTFGVPSTLSAGDYVIAATGITTTDSAFSADIATFSVAETGIVSDSTLRDGPLSLEISANAAASFSSPYLDDGISITEGTLPRFSVRDERVASKPGWTLYASVAEFVLSTDASLTMPPSQLGITPQRFAPESTAEGVTLGTPSRAGTSAFPMVFAQADPGATPGVTVLDATVKLVSPPYMPVGTYNSTVTLTLVSK